MKYKLSTTDHSRDIAGLKYVYPVLSRRAGGLSIGINFNPNSACNWRCVYCQVPGLVRGKAPDMDLELLRQELSFFLGQVSNGMFFKQFNVPVSQRTIKDIAISGNGEPTSLNNFDKTIELIGGIASEAGLFPQSNFVLISNGSLMSQSAVQRGLKCLDYYAGQVWYKLDSATESGRKKINDVKQSNEKTLENLKISSLICETRLQTCMVDNLFLDQEQERQAYLELMRQVKLDDKIKLDKIMLYTLARPSMQPEAPKLDKMALKKMNDFADQLRVLGYKVNVSS